MEHDTNLIRSFQIQTTVAESASPLIAVLIAAYNLPWRFFAKFD